VNNQTKEEWPIERRGYLGGSDAASIIGVGKWGCPRKLFYDKSGKQRDVDDSDKAEFRRGIRLEEVAASYYAEVTGRTVRRTKRVCVPGQPHLAVSMDRLTYKKEDTNLENPGYLELKVLGRWSMNHIKKEGLPQDYIIQMHWGLAVSDLSWGAFAIYSPETDELLQWDIVADKAFGNKLLDRGSDWWSLHKECEVVPEPLPEGSSACQTCPWSITCRGSQVVPAAAGEVAPVIEAQNDGGLLAGEKLTFSAID